MRRHIKHFFLTQCTAAIATCMDFTITFLVFYLFVMQYMWATIIGALCGGVINCTINYRWVFRPDSLRKRNIAVKYAIVWLGNIFLNAWGTYYITEFIKGSEALMIISASLGEYRFMTSKLITAIIVAIVWSYTLQASFVYKPVKLKRLKLKKQSSMPYL